MRYIGGYNLPDTVMSAVISAALKCPMLRKPRVARVLTQQRGEGGIQWRAQPCVARVLTQHPPLRPFLAPLAPPNPHSPPVRGLSAGAQTKHVWSREWDKISLGATPPWQHAETTMSTVLFVETGFGCARDPDLLTAVLQLLIILTHYAPIARCDQHGDRESGGGTKAAVRACRNAIEFNSIPCIQDLVPGGRPNMKIKIRLGVPAEAGEVCM